MTSWEVSKEESGQRLLDFLRKKMDGGQSLRTLKESLALNLCGINGRVERFGSKLVGWGDKVSFQVDQVENKAKKTSTAATILYEDDHFLLLDKPVGVSSELKAILSSLPSSYCPDKLDLGHRLDKETSGVLLLTKSKAASGEIFKLFKTHQMKKSYLALVKGVPQKRQGRIENHLSKVASYSGQSIWDAVAKDKGLLAITEWKLIKYKNITSLIECFPLTGRTHQIRVHLSGIGHPIIGDKQYGRDTSDKMGSRCMLHASTLAFTHPFTGVQLLIQAPLPQDFLKAMP